ncbi:hypothetical protein L484_016554 [Morus notabilis]|uniref:Uncharacterized protein n=1 Tax=Morus notabilis TaxID=981085 RepID=W9R6H4_9ROSA|nr:hypothetical protein L484_016554 [Morus notabilis]
MKEAAGGCLVTAEAAGDEASQFGEHRGGLERMTERDEEREWRWRRYGSQEGREREEREIDFWAVGGGDMVHRKRERERDRQRVLS